MMTLKMSLNFFRKLSSTNVTSQDTSAKDALSSMPKVKKNETVSKTLDPKRLFQNSFTKTFSVSTETKERISPLLKLGRKLSLTSSKSSECTTKQRNGKRLSHDSLHLTLSEPAAEPLKSSDLLRRGSPCEQPILENEPTFTSPQKIQEDSHECTINGTCDPWVSLQEQPRHPKLHLPLVSIRRPSTAPCDPWMPIKLSPRRLSPTSSNKSSGESGNNSLTSPSPVLPAPPSTKMKHSQVIPCNLDSVDLMDLSSEDDSSQSLNPAPSHTSPIKPLLSPVPLNFFPSPASICSVSSTSEYLCEVPEPDIFPECIPLLPSTPVTTPDLRIEFLEFDANIQEHHQVQSPRPLSPAKLLFLNVNPDDLTEEELYNFDMKYGSPHHGKSKSVKALSRPSFLSIPPQRGRVTSLPVGEQQEDEYYRLRHFSITGRRVVNRGDSFKTRRTRSNTSMASDASSNEGGAIWSHPCSLATSATSSAASSRASSTSEVIFPYRVIMLGAPGVGKTTLCHQFMTSEHINAYDSSLDEEYGEQSVSVMLDGEESEIQFIDHPTEEMSLENYLTTYDPHAFVVVFSVFDKESFLRAEELLQQLWKLSVGENKAVILVANKADVVRSRCVNSKESYQLAESYDCKFIETSSGLNHHVDELLVGILKQIRLKVGGPDISGNGIRRRRTKKKKRRGSKTSASLRVKSLLTKVCGSEPRSKSCENLHVL